ncbi:MAG: hypothetical protein JRF63_06785 [Deltaproteobacteria bacterium]|nr:hypothetical protein [Deltaproteobacteria bacterium]
MSHRGYAVIAGLLCLLAGTGCWKMQDLGQGSGDDPTDSDGDTTTINDTDTETNPWPDTIEMCDIDILFVFDTSLSMMTTVDTLSQSGFGGFTNMLASYPQPGTIHVAMTNHLYGVHEMPNNGDTQWPNCSEFLTHGMNHPVDTTFCEDVPDQFCNFASDEVWIEGPSDTLKTEFNCVGRLPCQEDVSHEEETLLAGLEALEDDFNAGFIRDDALLFLIFISDEDDASDMSNSAIHQGLLDLKGGDDDYVYVATMAGAPANWCESEFFGEAKPTPNIIAFADLFGDHGRHFNMCDTSAASALAAMVTMLTLACQEVL